MPLTVVPSQPLMSEEIIRRIVVFIRTPILLLKCRGLHPTISAVVMEELRHRHTMFFRKIVSNVDELFTVMRDNNAIVTSSGAFSFLTDTAHPYPYPFSVPYQTREPFINYLKYTCGFYVESDKPTNNHHANYCFASVRSVLGGVS
ncbi:hypothetical protein C8Q76DRAFT_796192 [Earliella scabrosa]|nr:hypothetical protein C8Q76DRAFT_796192 [Earliella scabrosa]